MFTVELKSNPQVVFYYDSFYDFEIAVREWYRAVIEPQESPMEYVLRNYNVYLGAKQLES